MKKKGWEIKDEALEHSDIINQDGLLLDECLNECWIWDNESEEDKVVHIPKRYWKFFRRWDEDKMEWIKK
jgi:hypothetical protein